MYVPIVEMPALQGRLQGTLLEEVCSMLTLRDERAKSNMIFNFVG